MYTTSFNDWDVADFSSNPEIVIMLAEGDEQEAEIEESFWLAGTAVTSTHNDTY